MCETNVLIQSFNYFKTARLSISWVKKQARLAPTPAAIADEIAPPDGVPAVVRSRRQQRRRDGTRDGAVVLDGGERGGGGNVRRLVAVHRVGVREHLVVVVQKQRVLEGNDAGAV